METIKTLTEDLHKGLILLRTLLRAMTTGIFNFKDIIGVITTLDRLIARIELLNQNDEEEYTLNITLDDTPQR
ncbi:hypothetical protein [Geminocystis sp. GBBB08]|uniref:hypothetical protein n=1 Tax=Geminocystis sp. GBBB08 TaxID=2604140 RepID=UPI0027E2548F|nr:hypothetical protein [Geminocystis sp. GBBB08]MBL1210677.1 hypothetical protein [Geminocystis sp. GBBB08]